jgi:hypothetical protein
LLQLRGLLAPIRERAGNLSGSVFASDLLETSYRAFPLCAEIMKLITGPVVVERLGDGALGQQRVLHPPRPSTQLGNQRAGFAADSAGDPVGESRTRRE